jgi:hypothetical protein
MAPPAPLVQVVIPPTNKTVGDLINFVGSITNSFYPYFYVPVPLAQRQTNVSINGGPYTGCPSGDDNNVVPTFMIVSFVQNITGYAPTSVAYVLFSQLTTACGLGVVTELTLWIAQLKCVVVSGHGISFSFPFFVFWQLQTTMLTDVLCEA